MFISLGLWVFGITYSVSNLAPPAPYPYEERDKVEIMHNALFPTVQMPHGSEGLLLHKSRPLEKVIQRITGSRIHPIPNPRQMTCGTVQINVFYSVLHETQAPVKGIQGPVQTRRPEGTCDTGQHQDARKQHDRRKESNFEERNSRETDSASGRMRRNCPMAAVPAELKERQQF
ncbi:hypothetical protein CEXT_83341 [Caerostris extrusa]|uniref:Uncharacterized protein n=1 Tax=Caerostris extrusa TaxID=172846 RepID=A0AAV4NFZ9_CAEEX|nr:hypothetical protein CEXT_83341 [Caerostris extrusa]